MIVAAIVGLELVLLIAIRLRSEFEHPVSLLIAAAIFAVAACLVVILIRSAPAWLVGIAIGIAGLPIVASLLFVSVLTGIAGSK